jgi:allophanate hydrolase subunit 1
VTATVHPYGDGAVLVEVEDVAAAHRLSAALDGSRTAGHEPPDVIEVVNGARSVVVRFEPRGDSPALVEQWVRRLAVDERSKTEPATIGAGTPSTAPTWRRWPTRPE